MKNRQFLLFPFLFFSACAGKPSIKNNYGHVYLTNDASFILLPPEHIEKELDMFQRISGAYGKNQFDMNVWVKADKTEIVMELFNDMGNSMGTLVFSGTELNFTSPYIPSNKKAEYAVADFQFCFFKADVLRSALGKLSLKIENDSAGNETRFIYDGKKCIIEIKKNPGLVRYINYLRGYSYAIQGDFP
jgi:hypothetical protein